MIVDAVVPARDEALTVGAVVDACRGCAYVRQVLVVDDGSSDGTAEEAAAAGAKVLRRDAPSGSKAHAMAEGVAATDADAVLFVDADCLGLRASHLDAICRPVLERRAAMSLGTFDYGILNGLVLRLPPTTGERVVPRWVFEAIPAWKLGGYTIELMINEVVAEGRLPTVARVMDGVYHRTKRKKFGFLAGTWASVRMLIDLIGLVRTMRVRAYWYYLHGLTIER